MSAPVQTLVERLQAASDEVAKVREMAERKSLLAVALAVKIARMEDRRLTPRKKLLDT